MKYFDDFPLVDFYTVGIKPSRPNPGQREKNLNIYFHIENNYNPSTNPLLFLVELLLCSTRAFSKQHFLSSSST